MLLCQLKMFACCVTASLPMVVQFTFGYGVGGEYPMAAGSAAERAEAKGRASARKRGREVPYLHSRLLMSMASYVAHSTRSYLCMVMRYVSRLFLLVLRLGCGGPFSVEKCLLKAVCRSIPLTVCANFEQDSNCTCCQAHMR